LDECFSPFVRLYTWDKARFFDWTLAEMRRFILQLMTFFVACHYAALATAEHWTQFRGGQENGVAGDVRLPSEWGPKTKIAWKVTLPGTGWSQPIVWGDKIFVTAVESDNQTKPNPKYTTPNIGEKAQLDAEYRWKILCIDAATGKKLWVQRVRSGRPTILSHINNTYASETPVTDGERVVTYFGMAGLYCYDFAGNQLWTRDLGVYPMLNDWGTGSSPILFGDKIYMQCDNEEKSFLVALNKKTGKDLWRVDRDELTNWSTPYIWKNRIRTELVTSGGGKMRSYDPETGKLLWWLAGSGRTAVSPVGTPEMIYLDSYERDSGFHGVLLAIRPGASGDISLQPGEKSNAFVAWSAPITGCRAASPAICKNCVFVLEEFAGIIHCYDATTGQQYYRKRIPDAAAGFTASPLVVGNKLYCIDQRGRTHIIEAGPELRVAPPNKLNEEMCWSSPAVAGDHLLIRTINHLYAIGED
jgi:outer membrane protein assembly factor BamB